MALIPSWFSASTKAIAEKALERGILKYPGMCFIQDTKSLAWVTQDNKLQYINGTNQITDIKFIGTNLMFYSNGNLIYSFDMSMTEEDAQHIIEQVKTSIGLDQYIKAADVGKLLDDIVGNLEDKSTVVDYINSLSYNKLSDKPIENLIGSLNAPVYISSLKDGIYKIKGQYIISQSNPTVQSSAEDVLFFISHDPELEKKMTITKMQGTSIVLYFLQADGTYRTDKYITENWVTDQNYMSADAAKEFITKTIQESVADVIDQQLDEKLDSALDKKIGGISTEELTNIFNN
ncbi:hypothetical protein DW272_01470 [Blautia obeum]|uniref:Uncharacterized protein n=1 Tax=Blautia obeum TaxID=40520 RepID=A0A414SJZ3_9FIRM|nr:hypothetical protein [Blautia obeum]RHG19902.1 hypothetical protein DW272_01470 [Blautia obeum]